MTIKKTEDKKVSSFILNNIERKKKLIGDSFFEEDDIDVSFAIIYIINSTQFLV